MNAISKPLKGAKTFMPEHRIVYVLINCILARENNEENCILLDVIGHFIDCDRSLPWRLDASCREEGQITVIISNARFYSNEIQHFAEALFRASSTIQ